MAECDARRGVAPDARAIRSAIGYRVRHGLGARLERGAVARQATINQACNAAHYFNELIRVAFPLISAVLNRIATTGRGGDGT